MSDYEKKLEELAEQWPMDPANVRCELCRTSTDHECGRCATPLCENTSCIISHIETYHPAWMPEDEE